MTSLQLESPLSPDHLYLARADEVPPWRPAATGDVFDEVPLTIDGERAGRAIVLTHPCSMRTDGVQLVERLLVAPVVEAPEMASADWRGHFRKMPLPALDAGGSFAANFNGIEPVSSTHLREDRRIAVLTPLGVNLLLQRLVNHMSRVVVETELFEAACAGAFAEVDLLEDWIEAATDAGLLPVAAAKACHEWLTTESQQGVTPQKMLADPQQRAAVRRDARNAVRSWIADQSDPTAG